METERTLVSVSQDLFQVVRHLGDNREVQAMYSYGLLLRVLDEHCRVKETEDGQLVEVEVKPAKEIPSDSLQNPSDPDAGIVAKKARAIKFRSWRPTARKRKKKHPSWT